MNKIRILNRTGMYSYMEWDYSPENNATATKRAYAKLATEKITDAKVWEVSPEVFWYSTPDKKVNCLLY